MALSDALATMAAKAKEAEDKFHAAESTQRSNLEEEVTKVRTAAEERSNDLRKRADETKSETSAWWRDVQQQWDRQVQQIRSNIQEKHEEHDAKRAAVRADVAEDDASFAIAIAVAAIEEAEYATLEAVLARDKAKELASAH